MQVGLFHETLQEHMGRDMISYVKVGPCYGANEDCFYMLEMTSVIADLAVNHCTTELE